MKFGILLGAALISLTLVLLILVYPKSETNSDKSESGGVPAVGAEENGNENAWVPELIEKCIAQIDVGEPLEMAASLNPFYLRANFDSNNSVDYAVLVQGQKTKKRGLVICLNSKEPFIFGAVSKPATPMTSFQGDNFITGNWEIMTKEETRDLSWNSGKNRIGTEAKGESVIFVYDGGSLVIYWDGKTFKFVQGV
jgi:hypothetical protein